jgi:LemA protein
MQYTIPVVVTVVIILLVLIYLSRSAKALRRLKNDLDKDWSDIEFLFKQRQDELPRLIQTSRSYVPGEKRVLDSVSAARALYQRAITAEQRAAANTAIGDTLTELFEVAGKHPDLQNNNAFVQLQTRIEELDERISERSELYRDEVNRFNTRITHFPGSVVARFAGLERRPLHRMDSSHARTTATQQK